MDVLTGLWTNDSIDFKGTYYTVQGRLEPRPLTKPHPPVWIGGWGDITLRRAATLADNWIPGPTADLKRLVQGKKQFLDNRAKAGRTAPVRGSASRGAHHLAELRASLDERLAGIAGDEELTQVGLQRAEGRLLLAGRCLGEDLPHHRARHRQHHHRHRDAGAERAADVARLVPHRGIRVSLHREERDPAQVLVQPQAERRRVGRRSAPRTGSLRAPRSRRRTSRARLG